MKRAIITGITGQDGSYLAELLLEQGYKVHGIVRRAALEDPAHRLSRLMGILHRIQLHAASMESFASLFMLIWCSPTNCTTWPHRVLSATPLRTHFPRFEPTLTERNLFWNRCDQCAPRCKVYFAGSSEMFGKAVEVPQTETTPFHPRSPYGISKVTGFSPGRKLS